MNGLQDIQNRQQQRQDPMQQQQQQLDQLYGYDPENMSEEQRKWWENFLQFLRESKSRDMQKFRSQMY